MFLINLYSINLYSGQMTKQRIGPFNFTGWDNKTPVDFLWPAGV